ncbi:MAG TPA: hypothetical protein VGI45_24510 [Terracidiphilus sp.]
MKPAKTISGTGQTANLDRILGAEEGLAPTSGFVSSVMDRVRQEAATPAPIPFPWKRVLPGMIVAAVGLVWCVVRLAQAYAASPGAPIYIPLHPTAPMAASLESAGWVVAALSVSLLSWLLARRLVGRSGLV